MDKRKIGIAAVIMVVAVILGAGWWSSGTAQRAQGKNELAVKYASEGNFEQAILAYNDAMKIDPNNVQAYQGLARVYILQGQYDKAQDVYKKGLALVETEQKTTLQLALAAMYLDQGDNHKAQEILTQEVENHPQEYRAHNFLALCLSQNGLRDEAFNHLVKSIGIEVDQQEAYLILNELFQQDWTTLLAYSQDVEDKDTAAMLEFYSYYAKEDYQEAVDFFESNLSEQPSNHKARILAAIALVKTGNTARAQEIMAELADEEINEWLLSDVAQFYLASGDKQKARYAAITALEAQPTNLDALAILQNLDISDGTIELYAAKYLLYNWKPVTVTKEELQARSLPIPEGAHLQSDSDNKDINKDIGSTEIPQIDISQYVPSGSKYESKEVLLSGDPVKEIVITYWDEERGSVDAGILILKFNHQKGQWETIYNAKDKFVHLEILAVVKLLGKNQEQVIVGNTEGSRGILYFDVLAYKNGKIETILDQGEDYYESGRLEIEAGDLIVYSGSQGTRFHWNGKRFEKSSLIGQPNLQDKSVDDLVIRYSIDESYNIQAVPDNSSPIILPVGAKIYFMRENQGVTERILISANILESEGKDVVIAKNKGQGTITIIPEPHSERALVYTIIVQ